ncbi:hypothetical protein NH340_JMT07222 [Sarcoptes scabiei]|nr:hypothetical protein NH340_JMT07222 [Sarcoptes scabiei]
MCLCVPFTCDPINRDDADDAALLEAHRQHLLIINLSHPFGLWFFFISIFHSNHRHHYSKSNVKKSNDLNRLEMDLEREEKNVLSEKSLISNKRFVSSSIRSFV